MPDMNENSETQQEYFGRANASRMSVEEREKTILLQQLSDREKRIVELEMTVGTLRTFSNEQATCIERFEKENKVLAQNLEDTEILNKTYEKRFSDLKKENAELKEFYEKEYFEIADRTADEKIKELEKYQTEVTIDDYSPYDENTWGMMHEEMFVPKELVRVLLKESYALSEHRNDQLTNAKEIIKKLKALYLSPVVTNDDVKRQDEILNEAEQFLNSEVEK